MMKKFGRWLARTLGTALSILMVVVLLPYASRLVQKVLPDLSDRAVTTSVMLSQQMQQSARLETMLVNDEGVVSSSTDALFIGTVQQVSVHYAYQASIGIDLTKVELVPRGNTLTLMLPAMEVLTDSITPLIIERDDFWYPLTDEQLQQLLEEKRLSCRNGYLNEYALSDEAWNQLCSTLDATLAQWLGADSNGLEILYKKASGTP